MVYGTRRRAHGAWELRVFLTLCLEPYALSPLYIPKTFSYVPVYQSPIEIYSRLSLRLLSI